MNRRSASIDRNSRAAKRNVRRRAPQRIAGQVVHRWLYGSAENVGTSAAKIDDVHIRDLLGRWQGVDRIHFRMGRDAAGMRTAASGVAVALPPSLRALAIVRCIEWHPAGVTINVAPGATLMPSTAEMAVSAGVSPRSSNRPLTHLRANADNVHV